jgi:hypothetical protein
MCSGWLRRAWFIALRFIEIRGFLFVTLFAVATRAMASEVSPIQIDAIQVGFAGHYKLGYWTPVTVTLSAGSQDVRGDLEVVIPDGDGAPTRVVERGVALAAGEKKGTRLFLKFGRPHAAIAVTLRGTDGTVLAERVFSGDEVPAALTGNSKSGGTKLILEMGSSLEYGSAIRFSEEGDPEETAVVHLTDPSQWPDRWDGYDGVDYVVMTTGQPSIYSQIKPAVFEALDRWLHLGGRMLVSVGRNGQELLASGMPLARFAPGRFAKTLSLRRFGALESFAGTQEPLDTAGGATPGERAMLDVALLQGIRGRIEAYEGTQPEDAPLVIRSGVGFGVLTFIAADLDAPPISRWKARPELLAVLLDRSSSAGPAGAIEPRGQGAQYGYDDLIGQLRAALDRFPVVTFVPFWLVAMLAVGYILLLFPFDYFLGIKLVGRSAVRGAAWPWLRFGAIVVGVSLVGCLLGWNWKGDRLQASQAAVIDFDAESGLARGTSWSSLFSPSSRSYSLTLSPLWHAPHGAPVETQLSWLGLPGSGIGGMNAPPAELPLFTEPYDVSEMSGTAAPVPLATWSSKCFTERWSSPGNRIVKAELHENVDRQLTGAIQLADGVAEGFKLNRCVLFYDRWAYLIDSFSASEPIAVDRLEARTAETYLTERRVVNERDQSKPYDRGSLDPARVLQMMMFYKAAGGRKYTGLLDRYQHELDLSDQLLLGRAVLVGVGPPAAELQIDGQPLPPDYLGTQLTIYRFVFPVQQGSETRPLAEPATR